MQSNQLVKIAFLFFTVTGLFFTSCKQNTAKTIQPARDYALIFREIGSVVPLVLLENQTSNRLKQILTDSIDTVNTCANFFYVSGDTSLSHLSNIQFNIDFSTGCVTNDNSFKEGVINCNMIEPFTSSSGKTILGFNGFRVDGNLFSGTITLETNSLKYKVTSNNLSISVGKKSIYYSGISNWEPLASLANDSIIIDNEFSVADSCMLTSRYSDNYICVSKELTKKCDCRWFTEGITEIVDTDNDTQILDFGNGSCDNKATVSSDQDIYNVDLQ